MCVGSGANSNNSVCVLSPLLTGNVFSIFYFLFSIFYFLFSFPTLRAGCCLLGLNLRDSFFATYQLFGFNSGGVF